MSKTVFCDGFMMPVSESELLARKEAMTGLRNELNNVVHSQYPMLDLASVSAGLTQNQVDVIKEFLSQFTNLSFHQMVKVKTLKFADSPVGEKKVELLKKCGFPQGDFLWDYAGVIDFGAETQQHCLLCGHPLRYGHRFVAENSLSLCLSGGCARHLFGLGPDVLNRMLTQSSTLLGSVAMAICAQRMGKRTDYLDYLCGMVGRAILKADVALMPFKALEEPVQGKHKLACQLLTGERVFYTMDWVREHIYLCTNLDLANGDADVLCATFPKSCVDAMLGMKQSVLLLSKFLGVGLLPPLMLVQEINKGLNACVLNHHIPVKSVSSSDVEDVSKIVARSKK